MSELIIVNFRSAKAAFEAGAALAVVQGQARTEPEDIVVITRDTDGRVAVNQSVNRTTGKTLGGGAWGMLIGMLFADRSEQLAKQFRNLGLAPDFLTALEKAPPKSGAAVGMRVRMLGADRVVDLLKSRDGAGKVIRTQLSAEAEDQLIDLQAKIPGQALAHVNSGGRS
jgi:uncharacterized membrane protein